MTSCMWLAERMASAPGACASDAACGALTLAPARSGEGVESGTSGASRPASALSAPAIPCAPDPEVLVLAALIPVVPVAPTTACGAPERDTVPEERGLREVCCTRATPAPTAPLNANADDCAESGDR